MKRILNFVFNPKFLPISCLRSTIHHVTPGEFKTFQFHGGEEHIKLNKETINTLKESDVAFISRQMSSSDAVMQTLLLTDAIRQVNSEIKLNLVCPYFPYARQDRKMEPGEPFSLKFFAKLINSQKYNKVTVLDPHSDVTPGVIDNVDVIDNCDFVKQCLDNIKNRYGTDIVLVSPDAGAYKKIFNVAKYCNMTADTIINGNKVRNVANGQIMKIGYNGDVQDKICVIVDDIIDGGMTFIKLANALRNGGADKVILIVTHGIFSNSFESLRDIDRIYTTDSFQTFNDNVLNNVPFVEQIKFKMFLDI